MSDTDLSVDDSSGAESLDDLASDDFDFEKEMAAWALYDEDMELEAQISEDDRLRQFDEIMESHIESEAWENSEWQDMLFITANK